MWIDFLRGADTPYRRRLHDLIDDDEDICTMGIVITEILQCTKAGQAADQLQTFLLDCPVFEPHSVLTYIEAANIYRQCLRIGRTVRKTVDCIIAAIAIENDLTLFPNDADFLPIVESTGQKTLTV